jgi:organic radical activating enzyme
MIDHRCVDSADAPVSGYLSEIFSGIQGEGLFVGARQVFIRLTGCNLGCAYCDTRAALTDQAVCRVEQTPGLRDFISVENPVSHLDVISYVARLSAFNGAHHSVSLTGGEPLMQTDYAAAIARGLKENGTRVFLETNGSLPDALLRVLPCTDIVSMDIKLPSTTGGADLMAEHGAFLEIAKSSSVYVKIVVTSSVPTPELMGAVAMIERVDPSIPLVIQPVASDNPEEIPSPSQLLEWQLQCMAHLRDVRVIPQCHKFMGQL